MADLRLRRPALGVAALIVLGLAFLIAPEAARPTPRFVWNASASAPLGLYRVMPGAPVEAGDWVVARAPVALRRFAAERRYIPANVPLVKRVAGIAPARVCAVGPRVLVDGRLAAYRLPLDGEGRALPWWTGCRRLQGGELLLLMGDVPSSFDGRYFGPTVRSDVLGKARLIWAR